MEVPLPLREAGGIVGAVIAGWEDEKELGSEIRDMIKDGIPH